MVETEATRSGLGGKRRRPGLLVAGLCVVVLTVAVLQTAVVPVLGIIAHQLNASTVAASWAVTANLLAAAAATPLIGRLADLHSKKHVLLVVLAVVLVGSVLAATTSSLALLIIARVLQAASFALYPIGVAILREELTEDRMVSAMSVLSGTLGFGGGTGLVVVGLLMSGDAGYHRVFWLTTGFTRRRHRDRGPRRARAAAQLDGNHRLARGRRVWPQACRRSLLAITQGHSRGAGRRRRPWACAACGLVVLGRLVVLGAPGQTAAGVHGDADPAPDHAHQPRHRVRRHGTVLRVPRADAVRPNPPRGSGIRLRGDRAAKPASSTCCPARSPAFSWRLVSGRFIDRFGARPVLVVAAVAGIAGFLFIALAHSCAVADHRGQHPGQRLHQPGLRRAARAGGQRGRRR